jgi:Holliday junction resolvase RusA-like endonuclease
VPGLQLRQQQGNDEFLEGPLLLQATFFMAPPSSISIKRKKLMSGNYHSIRPDLDNLIKWICDISNGIIFQDDALVCEIAAKKIYDLRARTEFTFQEII